MRARKHSVFLASCLVVACESSPPPLQLPDGATLDAGRDAGDGSIVRGDAGPALPPADRTIVLPFGAPAQVVPYEIASLPSRLDLHVSMDTTASFREEIEALQDTLVEDVLPEVRETIPDTSVGVSSFEDFPREPFGAERDEPFTLHVAVTSDASRVGRALRALDDPLGVGGDFPESGFEALYQIATGAGYKAFGRTYVPARSGSALEGGGTEGGVGFRPGSLRAVLHITDAPSHGPDDYEPHFPGTRGLSEALAALNAERIRVVGIASGQIPRDELSALAIGTAAVMPPTDGACPTGVGGALYPPVLGSCPLVFDVLSDGTGLSDTLKTAIARLVETIRFDAVAFDLGEDRLGFVSQARAVSAIVPDGAPAPTLADVSPMDGVPETFLGVHAGATLRFELSLENDLLPELDYEQIFLVSVAIVADGTVLRGETLRIIVPRRALPDAGTDAGID